MSKKLDAHVGDVMVEWSRFRRDAAYVAILVLSALAAVGMIATSSWVTFVGCLLLVASVVSCFLWLAWRAYRIYKNPPKIRDIRRKQQKSRDALLVDWEDVFEDIEKHFQPPDEPSSK